MALTNRKREKFGPFVKRYLARRSVGWTAVGCVALGSWFWIFPALRVEQRSVSKDGSVDFSGMNSNALDLEDWLEGLRQSGHFAWVVRDVVYDETGVYIFAFGGRVYAMGGNESGIPATLMLEWKWSGDPHEFPYYREFDNRRP